MLLKPLRPKGLSLIIIFTPDLKVRGTDDKTLVCFFLRIKPLWLTDPVGQICPFIRIFYADILLNCPQNKLPKHFS